MKICRAIPALVLLAMVFAGCRPGMAQPTQTVGTSTPVIQAPSPEAAETAQPTATQKASAAPSPTSTAAPAAKPAWPPQIDEENFMQYFQFGMSGKAIKQKLKECGIQIMYEDMDVYDCEHGSGFHIINAELAQGAGTMSFYTDKKDRLYMINGVCATAKGLASSDSLGQMRSLYGAENEIDDAPYQYLTRDFVYYRNGYLFSVNTRANPQRTDYLVDGWSVFVNVWNPPGYFDESPANAYHGDDFIQFNEDNYTRYFRLGMTMKAVVAKLTSLGIRITNEKDTGLKPDNWYVYTDHIGFYFDTHSKLYAMYVRGWETAKGLSVGDMPDRLHALYGKEKSFTKVRNQYIYQKKGYKFAVFFDSLGTMDNWSVFTREP